MVTNRHAYLILVHHQPRLLQVLIDMIDDERNDIYIHVDKKADIRQFDKIHAEKSRIVYTDRVSINWGAYSMVEAEYILLRAAQKDSLYQYYHLLSGVDLPLKTQDEIHQFFDDMHPGKEFVRYAEHQSINHRVRYFSLFDRSCRNRTVLSKGLDQLRIYALMLQKQLGVWRHKEITFYKGAQWFSITDDLCRYLIQNETHVRKLYRMTSSPDESFVQTLIRNTTFYERVYDKDDEFKSCMRQIDWERDPQSSSPHTWTRDDWDELTQSDRLFARKFSEDDMDFIYRLRDYVLN